jgi:hypothetical protein
MLLYGVIAARVSECLWNKSRFQQSRNMVLGAITFIIGVSMRQNNL